ncbi:MAG: hypothetical protein AAGA84_10560 [Pseudomonadota bacterium]
MLSDARTRRRIGVASWIALSLVTLYWLIAAAESVHWLGWLALLVPFVLLLPGLIRPTRNAFLLALLGTVGYASVGLMDAIANPESIIAASVLAIASLACFFLLIPAVRTLPAPPKEPD